MTTTAPKSVSRVYTLADGTRAVLLYTHRDGAHRVTYRGPEGDAETWRCEDVEAARARWAKLARRLRAQGYDLATA